MDTGGAGGHIIAGRYRLIKQLGRGGMGSVWRAEDLQLGSPVAVKLIDPTLASDEAVRERFYQEAKAAASLRSPHVVQILEYGVDGEVPFIAMELLEGMSLADRLARVRIPPYAETASIFGDVARAVRKAHDAGIVHRDLKPDNIFLVRNDDQEIAKVLDFGIAKSAPTMGAQSRATGTGSLIGTPPYMSPEQARGAKVDHRTDLWALGVIAFECVCGRLPFAAEAPGELVLQICAEPIPIPSQVTQVPAGFDAWFAHATARNPAERFQSAKDMADALRLALLTMGGVPQTPREVSPGILGGDAVSMEETPSRPAPEPPIAGSPDPRFVPKPGTVAKLGAPAADREAPESREPAAPRRPETMNGGSAFVSGLTTPSRPGFGARAGTLVSGAALFFILLVAWLTMGRKAELPPAPASSGPTSGLVAAEQVAAPQSPDPGPVVSPAGTAPVPSVPAGRAPSQPSQPTSAPVKPIATPAGEPPSRRSDPAPVAPPPPVSTAETPARPAVTTTAAPKAAAAPGGPAPDKKKPDDRIGF